MRGGPTKLPFLGGLRGMGVWRWTSHIMIGCSSVRGLLIEVRSPNVISAIPIEAVRLLLTMVYVTRSQRVCMVWQWSEVVAHIWAWRVIMGRDS